MIVRLLVDNSYPELFCPSCHTGLLWDEERLYSFERCVVECTNCHWIFVAVAIETVTYKTEEYKGGPKCDTSL